MEERKKSTNGSGSSERKKPGRSLRPKPPEQQRPDDDFNWNRVLKVVLSWSAVILVVFLVMSLFRSSDPAEVELSYTEYRKFLQEGAIAEGTVRKSDLMNYDFHGVMKQPQSIDRNGRTVMFQNFTLTLPVLDASVVQEWTDAGVKFTVTREDNTWVSALLGALPWLLLLVLWFIIMRRMQGTGPKGIFSFGKSRAKMISEGQPRVTFQDVAGADEAKMELAEVIDFLREPTKFQKLGGKIPRGVLLLGPPGTGKTLLARAVAGEAGVPFFSISGADFVEMFVGVGAGRCPTDRSSRARRAPHASSSSTRLTPCGSHLGAWVAVAHR